MLSPFVGWPLARPDDALQLAVSMQAEDTAVAPDAGHLEPAERRLVVALHGVDADVAAAELPRHPITAHRATTTSGPTRMPTRPTASSSIALTRPSSSRTPAPSAARYGSVAGQRK